ncbi:hypothetical protein [Isoptericola sp. NPDC058082]|uniref:hypothetical protein n=1 Tax=Isoptericola sp. NPDC058082 TaxID=3346331 RepID=UPI0036F0EA6A
MNPRYDPTARLRRASEDVQAAAEASRPRALRQTVHRRRAPTPVPGGAKKRTATKPVPPKPAPAVEPGGAILTAAEMSAVDHLLATHPETRHFFQGQRR